MCAYIFCVHLSSVIPNFSNYIHVQIILTSICTYIIFACDYTSIKYLEQNSYINLVSRFVRNSMPDNRKTRPVTQTADVISFGHFVQIDCQCFLRSFGVPLNFPSAEDSLAAHLFRAFVCIIIGRYILRREYHRVFSGQFRRTTHPPDDERRNVITRSWINAVRRLSQNKIESDESCLSQMPNIYTDMIQPSLFAR